MKRLAAAVLLFAAPAMAQDRPPTTPAKDAAVTYKTVGKGGGQSTKISYNTAGLMRIDNPSMPGFAVVDRARQKTTMVMADQRMYMEMQGGMTGAPTAMSGPPADAKFVRKGTDTVAGHACSVWEYNGGGEQGVSCITADGVVLRSLSKGEGIEATNVVLGPIPAANFQVPAGFAKMDMPAMGGMGGMPPRR